jgi:RNA pol II promoter Fmp27 protein domain/Golgi-body localisation protein domain
LCKTLEALYEKKIALERHIKLCIAEDEVKSQQRSDAKVTFESNNTIHNVNVLWNVAVRNAVFKMIELQTKDFQIKYCVSNTAARVVSELVKSSNLESSRTDISMSKTVSHDALSAKEQTQVMLEKLLNDLRLGINLEVHDETGESMRENTESESPVNSTGFKRSLRAGSPDYIERDHIVELDTLWKFINPQVCLELDQKGKRQCVIIAAPNVQVTSFTILDAAAAGRMTTDDKDRADMIFKTRTVVNLYEAQFLVGSELAQDVDKVNRWPYWVPIESLVDSRVSISNLTRTIERATLTYHRDKINPLYVSSTKKEDDGPNTFTLTFPVFTIIVNQQQYGIWFDCINKLLIYRDPDSGLRADRLRKMLVNLL